MTWPYFYSSDIWPALITLALTIFLGSYSWSRRHIPAAKPFVVACFIGGLWTLGAILELSAVNFSTKVFWVKFQAIWHLPIAAVITCFVLQYAGLGRQLTHRNCVFLFLVPLLCMLLMVTNGSHHLIWTGFRMNGYVTVLSGRLFWFFISYGIILGIFNLAVMFWLAIFSPDHRRPVAIMVVSQIVAHVGYIIDKLGTDLFGPGEAVLLVVGVVCSGYALAFLRFHVIDPVAAARKAVLGQMSEGLLVLDLQGRIVDVNPMAASILGMPEKKLFEKPLTEVMPVDTGLLEQLRNKKIGQAELTLGEGTSARHYTLKLTPLRGRRGEIIGQLLLLHNVTEEKRAQTRILEEKSVVATLKERERLARDLHDGIGQILGYVSIQAQTALKWIKDGNHEKAESLLGRLVEVAKDAHADIRESITDLRSASGRERSFIPTLKNYIDKFQSNYGIRTELSLSKEIGENTFDPMVEIHLFRVIQEALTNSRKHSGAHNLRVIMGLDGNMACITITDDGDGFDAGQLKSCVGGHFGLIFMQERMEQIGGSLKIDSIPGGGTVLSLDVPIRENQEETQGKCF